MTGDMRRDSELGALMPMMYQNHRRSSITNANDTVEIRQYMDAAMGTGGGQGQGQGQEARVRRESIVHIGPLVTPSGKVVSKRLSVAMNRAMDERADRSPAKGQGQGQGQAKFKGHPNAKKFSIRVRNPGDKKDAKKDAKKNATSGPLDPEGIKDAVLQQAILQRRALVHKSLRQGTGRSVQRAKFELNVVLRTPVQPSPEPVADGNDKYQTSTQQAGADGDLSPFNFGGRATKALSPMEGVPERLEFSGVVAEGKKRGSQQLMPPPPPVAAGDAGDAPNDDADAFDFGYDDYGGGDDDYGWIDDPQPPLNDPLPGREACNPDGVIAPKRKRIVMNPGSRLRGELRRKSLANDANVGLQEVAGGLRRSTRRSQEPLKWWLNEKKVMSRRKYKAMPTVAAVITDPNPASPWRTVEDPTGARQDKTKVKGPPKKKGPKKGVKQVLATKEATARTPPFKQKQTANDDAVDVDAAEAAEVLDVVDVVDIAEDANDDEMTEDDDTLMIGSIANNDDDLSDVAVPLGAKRKSEGKATSNSRKSSKSTRKSTKSMGTIPEDGTGVASPSNADSVTDDVGDDEIIIGRASVRRGSRGSRGSSAHAAQSETIGDEATLNMQAEPSTATTVDQGHDGDLEETDNIEGIEGIENANANKKQTARSSDVSGSPSKEPARRSARNRRTVSST